MNILHIIPSLRKGGAERLVIDICAELNKRDGVTTKLVTLTSENLYQDLTTELDWQVITSYVTPSISSKAKIDIADFEKVVQTFKPDIIHSHLFEAEMVSRVKLFEGVKYFTHCHDDMAQFKKFSLNTLFNKRLLTNYFERNLILRQYKKCNNNFIAISVDTLSYFKKNLPIALTPNILLQPNAINFRKFNASYSVRNTDELRIVNVGSFVSKKNQIFLLEILNSLRDKKQKVSVTFLGDGPLIQDVRRKAVEYCLDDVTFFPGSVNRVEDYLKQANLYVHTATYEPFGLVLLEAMASGLPVISLDGRGNRDIVKDNWNGFLIEEQKPEIFAQKVISLMSDKEKYSNFSTNAVEFSREFDIVSYVDKLFSIYRGSTP